MSNRLSSHAISGCHSCKAFYFHCSLLDERRNGVKLKTRSYYCFFPKKPMKLDGRKRHTEIPTNCPRYSIPVRFTVYTLKKRAPSADSGAGYAERYWHAYQGDLDMVERIHLIGDKTYFTPDVRDGFLMSNGEGVFRLKLDDVVIREDGFTVQGWSWTGSYLLMLLEFDESGIKKMPKPKGNQAGPVRL